MPSFKPQFKAPVAKSHEKETELGLTPDRGGVTGRMVQLYVYDLTQGMARSVVFCVLSLCCTALQEPGPGAAGPPAGRSLAHRGGRARQGDLLRQGRD